MSYSDAPDPITGTLFGSFTAQDDPDLMRRARQLQESSERQREGPLSSRQSTSLFAPEPRPSSAYQGSFSPLKPDTFVPYSSLNVPFMSDYAVPQVGEKGIAAILRRNMGDGIAGRGGRQLMQLQDDSSTGASGVGSTGAGIVPADDVPQPQGYSSSYADDAKSAIAVGVVHGVADMALHSYDTETNIVRATVSAASDFVACQAVKAIAPDYYDWGQPFASAALYTGLAKINPGGYYNPSALAMEFLMQLGSSVVGAAGYDALSSGYSSSSSPAERRLLAQPVYTADSTYEALRSVTVGAVNYIGTTLVDGKSTVGRAGASAAADFIACQTVKQLSPKQYIWAQPLVSASLFPLATCALEGKRGALGKEFLTQLGSTVVGTAVYSYSPVL